MAHTPSEQSEGSGQSTNTLPRGKACLRCRKRKMRCDGVKPACAQCAKAKKPDCCQYDDGKGKTRTQALREKIARLEEELAHLRDPEYAAPAIVLHDPHASYHSGSSSSSAANSPSSIPLSVSPSPFNGFGMFPDSPPSTANGVKRLVKDAHSPQPSWSSLRPITPNPNDDMHPELCHMLLDIFLPHSFQSGFVLHVERLRASLSSLAPSDRRHPVLMNAVYLWACFLSRPGSLGHHEQHYLTRALESLPDALQQQVISADLVQAEILISRYFFANGRMLEASYHASAAATLALHGGFHRIAVAQQPQMTLWSNDRGKGRLELDPPQNSIEMGERVCVFWQAFVLDRCLAVVLQRQPCIPEDDAFGSRIDTPWPEEIRDYENMSLGSLQGDNTLQTFFGNQGQHLGGTGGFSRSALRVKASALYETASRLSSGWGQTPTQATDFRALEVTLARFLSNLLPIQQIDAALPEDRRCFILLHTLVHATMVQLHQRFAKGDPGSLDKCVRAARCAASLIKHVTEQDYDFLDPVIGSCWSSVYDVLAMEQLAWSAAAVLDNDLQNELDTINYAMNKLGTRFPLMNYYIAQRDFQGFRFFQQ